MADQEIDNKQPDKEDTPNTDEEFDAVLSKGYSMVEKGDIREALKIYRELKSLYRQLRHSEKGSVFAKCINFQKLLRKTYKKLLDEMEEHFTHELKEEFDALFWGLSAKELVRPDYREISVRYNHILTKYLP